MFKNVGIRSKLSLVFIAFALLMLVGLGLPIYSYAQSALVGAVYSKLQIAVLEKQSPTHAWIDDVQSQLKSISAAEDFEKELNTAREIADSRIRLQELLKNWIGPQQKFEALMVLSPADGRVIVATDSTPAGQPFEDQTFFTAAMVKPSLTSLADPEQPQQASLYAGVPVHSPSGAPAGVLVGRLKRSELARVIQLNSQVWSSLKTYLIAASGQLLVWPGLASDAPQPGFAETTLSECQVEGPGDLRENILQGGDAINAFIWLPEIQSCLLVEVATQDAFSGIKAYRLLGLIVASASLLASIGLALLLGGAIARPIVKLMEGVEEIGRGKLATRIPVRSGDEIGRLTESINAMAANLSVSQLQTSYNQRVLVSLSQAAQAMLRSKSQEEVFARIGEAFNQLGYGVTIMAIDDSGEYLTIPFSTIQSASLDFAERITGMTFESYRLKLTPDSNFTRIVTTETTALFDPAADAISDALPKAFRPLAERIASRLGIEQSLLNRIEVAGAPYGLLAITGKGLTENDINAVTVFAKQASIALDNIRLIENLQSSEALFRSLIENASDLIAIVDVKTHFTYLSPSVERLFGYSPVELIGRPATSLVHPEDLPAIQRAQAEILQDPEGTRQLEFRFRHKDGDWRVLDVFGKTFELSSGEPAIILNARDVSEQRAAADALRQARDELEQRVLERTAALEESQRSLETLMGNLPGMAYRCQNDRIWTMEFASQGSLELTGYTPQVLIRGDVGYNDLIHPEDREMVWEKTQQAIDQRESYTLSYRIVDASGIEKWIWEKGQGIFDRNGNLLALEGFISDVSGLVLAQQALREGEETLRSLLNAIPESAFLVQPDGTVINANQTFASRMQASLEELIGQPFYRFLEPEVARTRQAYIDEVVKSGNPVRFEDVRFGRVIDNTLYPIFDERGQVERLAILGLDITQRRQSEEQLKRTMDDLARSNAELEQFAYVASHDLQEPLRMVASYLQLVERRYAERLDEDGHEFIQYAVEGATRMKALINDLLAYSRVGTRGEALHPTSCEAALQQALKNLQLAIEDQQAVIESEPLPEVMGDEAQLIQLFQNLIGNAIKFHGEQPPRVRVCVQREPDEWIISVQDNGLGFETQYASRIFVIFQRLNPRENYPGTGIGLAISKRIVERHGGRIWVESTPGAGSTFFFSLPVLEPSSELK